MSAYKNAIMNLKPKCFITFDGDAFDPFSGVLTGSPPVLIDESGHANVGVMQGDVLGYSMGQTSLVEIELGGVYSCIFGQAGFFNLGDPFPKAYVEIPNSSDFNFNNFGSFTVSMFVEKTATEAVFRAHPELGWPLSGNNNTALFRPIISKGPALIMGFIDNIPVNGSNDQRIRVIDPNGTQTDVTMPVTYAPFLNDQKHLVYVWNVIQTAPNIYKATSTLYINSVRAFQNTYNYTFTYPNTATPASWFIAGAPTTPISGDPLYNFSDRCTAPTLFDQIAIFDYGLTELQVASLFKKTRPYDRVVAARVPQAYFPMEDAEIAGNYTVINQGLGNTGNGTLYGGSSLVHRRVTGPKIPAAFATFFTNGGMGELCANPAAAQFPIFTADFTVDCWINCGTGDRGVVFALPQNDNYPFDGPVLQMNWANDQATPGAFQFNIRQDLGISTPPGYTWNDGLWHHVACIRRGTFLELWVDGLMQAQSGTVAVTQTANTGFARSMYIMGMLPEKLHLTGSISKVAVQYSALQPYEIQMRYTYSMAYRLFGGVTLQTNPVAANIRVYRHFDGSLVTTGVSDPVTGKFEIDVPNYDKYDLMFLSGSDPTVRYRAYGPMVPGAYPDTALN